MGDLLSRWLSVIIHICVSGTGVFILRFCRDHYEGTGGGWDSLCPRLSMMCSTMSWGMCVWMSFDIHFAARPNWLQGALFTHNALFCVMLMFSICSTCQWCFSTLVTLQPNLMPVYVSNSKLADAMLLSCKTCNTVYANWLIHMKWKPKSLIILFQKVLNCMLSSTIFFSLSLKYCIIYFAGDQCTFSCSLIQARALYCFHLHSVQVRNVNLGR